jgi:tetratricopeptide (TPR) repeat protein
LTTPPPRSAALGVILAICLAGLIIPGPGNAEALRKSHKSAKPELKRRTRLEILQTLIKSKRWDQAERVATRLLAGTPDNPEAYFLAGIVQFRQARYDRAIPLLKKAQELRAEIPGLSKTLAICYFSSRQHRLFESQMEHAFLQTPTDPELSFFWGLHQTSVNDNPRAAVKAFDHALQHRPSYVQALYHRGRAFQKMGHKDKARKDFEASIALIEQTFFRGYSYPYQSMARLLLEDSPKGALRFALKSVEVQPRLKNTHILVGEIHWRLGQFNKAAEAFEDATYLDPEDSRLHYWLHLLYQRMGKKKASEMALLEFQRLNPSESGATHAATPPPIP